MTVLSSQLPAGKRRLVLLSFAVVAAIVLSVVAGTLLLRQRKGVEILVQDVAMLLNVPEDGRTELHAFLVVRNPLSSPIHIDTIVLVAYDPKGGALFDTYTHEDLQVSTSQTWSISEVSVLNGLWSEVSFSVRIFPVGAPSWESPLTPDQPVTWYPG